MLTYVTKIAFIIENIKFNLFIYFSFVLSFFIILKETQLILILISIGIHTTTTSYLRPKT